MRLFHSLMARWLMRIANAIYARAVFHLDTSKEIGRRR